MNSTNKTSIEALRSVMHAVRAGTPITAFPRERAASSDIRTGYVNGQPVNRLVITLRGPGCVWVKRGTGCVMCGHYAGTLQGAAPTVEETISQFRSEIAKYEMENISVLSLYNSGSVLNPAEFHFESLKNILAEIGNLHSIKKVVLESRAEFVCTGTIEILKDILGPDKILSIAIGFETSDDIKRELCINKGSTLLEIENAVRSLNGIAETQLYVLVGLPFLTESEAIEDAVDSIRYAGDIGADEIHIEPITFQRHTLFELLLRHNLSRLPSLYSVYEVLKQVVPDIRPYVSPFMHMPLPDRIPRGCISCTERLIHGLLNRYNIFRDSSSLEYENCDCMSEWYEHLAETDDRPISKRVMDAVSVISCGVGT